MPPMEPIALGTDIVEVDRIRALCKRYDRRYDRIGTGHTTGFRVRQRGRVRNNYRVVDQCYAYAAGDASFQRDAQRRRGF